MPKMTSFLKTICLPLALALFAGCSGSHDSGALVDAKGNHPSNWVQQHWMAYRDANGGSSAVSAATACSECHGSDLSGGISKVSCFSASYNGMNCHANGDRTFGHPAYWADPTSRAFHAYTTFNGARVKGATDLAGSASCGMCHATDAGGTSVGTAPSCLTTDPKWGISCHAKSPAASSTGCVSCHSAAAATGPAGTAAPDRAGAHAKHLALGGVTCNTCHGGFGSGTERHATARFVNHTTAFLKLATSYNAQTGAFSYTDARCAGVSCHGGRQTPVWTGAINPSTQCLSCHEQGYLPQPPQYNSFYSGSYNGENLHQFHLTKTNRFTSSAIFCTDCHSLAKLDKHFTGLATPAFEGAAGDTVDNTAWLSYAKDTQTCTATCHQNVPVTAHWNQ